MTQVSTRLRLVAVLSRRIAKPRLAATPGPLAARAEYDRVAPLLFPRPPGLVHLVDAPRADGTPAVHWLSCGAPAARGVLLFLHGGAYVAGSPRTHAGLIGTLARATGLRAAAPAYARAPERPAPAAFDDAVAAHARLLALGHAPAEIVLAGDSAGGGLALALLADLCRRDLRPAGLAAFSPWTDLALTGESLVRNAAADPLLPVSRIAELVGHVRGALPPQDPRLSPLYAAYSAPPPVLIQVGRSEILHDDATRMAARLRAAGGEVRLSAWDGVPHAWHLLGRRLPEARAAIAEAGAFLRAVLRAALRSCPDPR